MLSACSGAKRIPGEPFATHLATVKTSMGSFTIELYGEDAPATVKNFVTLAERDFYDGILFHRVVKDFIIQAGDPLTRDPNRKQDWGTGGESTFDEDYTGELNKSTISYQRGYQKGVVAMANVGGDPKTNTSQFFVMLKDNTSLPKQYTIFGKVVEGIDVVEKMGLIEVEPGTQRPKSPPKITGIEIDKR